MVCCSIENSTKTTRLSGLRPARTLYRAASRSLCSTRSATSGRGSATDAPRSLSGRNSQRRRRALTRCVRATLIAIRCSQVDRLASPLKPWSWRTPARRSAGSGRRGPGRGRRSPRSCVSRPAGVGGRAPPWLADRPGGPARSDRGLRRAGPGWAGPGRAGPGPVWPRRSACVPLSPPADHGLNAAMVKAPGVACAAALAALRLTRTPCGSKGAGPLPSAV